MAQNNNAPMPPSTTANSPAADDRSRQPAELEFQLRMDLLRSTERNQRLKLAEAIAARTNNY